MALKIRFFMFTLLILLLPVNAYAIQRVSNQPKNVDSNILIITENGEEILAEQQPHKKSMSIQNPESELKEKNQQLEKHKKSHLKSFSNRGNFSGYRNSNIKSNYDTNQKILKNKINNEELKKQRKIAKFEQKQIKKIKKEEKTKILKRKKLYEQQKKDRKRARLKRAKENKISEREQWKIKKQNLLTKASG